MVINQGAPHRNRHSVVEHRGCPHLVVVGIVCLGESVGIAASIVDSLAILVDHVMAPAGSLVAVVMQLHPVHQPALFRCWRRRLLFVRRPLQERGASGVGLRLLLSVHPAEGNVHSAAFQVVVDHQQVAQQLQAHLARVLVDLDAVAFSRAVTEPVCGPPGVCSGSGKALGQYASPLTVMLPSAFGGNCSVLSPSCQ
ncbi:hypothetical protein XAUB_36110 [Xanthomonas citri pv. aurantifolii str. ICPB 11122]|nr:hypothetical protein XAUB_36110 [Xanthomonas citri pv. aurantifolii str. ICPB 11122]